MSAGALNVRLQFFAREVIEGEDGNRRGDWVRRFDAWAEMKSRPGSEAFTAARFEGRIPYQTRIRWSPQAMQIATDWKARDSRGAEYDVQAPQPDLVGRQWVDMVLVAGSKLD
jgi:head-tail adaptor